MTFSEINHALASGSLEDIARAILAIEALPEYLREAWEEYLDRADPLPQAWHEVSR
jgi:hypothetical protein